MMIQTQFSLTPEGKLVSTLPGPQLLCHDTEIFELSKFSKSPIEIKNVVISKVPGLFKKKFFLAFKVELGREKSEVHIPALTFVPRVTLNKVFNTQVLL